MQSSLGLLALAVLAAPAWTQVRSPGRPASDTASLPSDVPTFVVPAPDIQAYKAEDEAREHRPYRFGAAVATSEGILAAAPDDGAFRTDIAEEAVANLVAAGIDVNGSDFAKIEVAVTEGGN